METSYECEDCGQEFTEEEYSKLFVAAGLYRRPVTCPVCKGKVTLYDIELIEEIEFERQNGGMHHLDR